MLATLALGGGTSAHIETITVPAAPLEDTSLVSRAAVPRLVGLPLNAARRRARGAGFLVEVEGTGVLDLVLARRRPVSRQEPRPGVVRPIGSTIHLEVAPR